MGNSLKKLLQDSRTQSDFESVFHKMDRDENGKLDKEEWVRFAEELRGLIPNAFQGTSIEEFIEKTFKLADKDGNGSISFLEFKDFITKQSWETPAAPEPAPATADPGNQVADDVITVTQPKVDPRPGPGGLTPATPADAPAVLLDESEASEELKAFVTGELRGNSISSLSCTRPSFIKPRFFLFQAQHFRPPVFAHDRGDMDQSLYSNGLWDTETKASLSPQQYGSAFSRFDLTLEEAIGFWRIFTQDGKHETETLPHRGQAPSWKNNELRLSVYKYTGMRGSVYNHWTVQFPSAADQPFVMKTGDLSPEVQEEHQRLADMERRKEEEKRAAEKKRDEERSQGNWAAVPAGLTAFGNEARTVVGFVEWDGRSMGYTNSHPNGAMPNCNLSSGPISPRILSSGGNYSEDWEGHPLAYCLNKLALHWQLAPVNDARLHALTVNIELRNDKDYVVVIRYKGKEIPIDPSARTLTTYGAVPSPELTKCWDDSLQEKLRVWADREGGLIALATTGEPGGYVNSRYQAMSGSLRFWFKVDPADSSLLSGVQPATRIQWRS